MPDLNWWRKKMWLSLIGLAGMVAVAGLYTLYKAMGRALDDAQRDWWLVGSVLPRTEDRNMPPLRDVLAELTRPASGTGEPLWNIVFDASLSTLHEAVVGFALGVMLGLTIAILLARFRTLEKGAMPYVIASQTIPLIALAPIIVLWGRQNFGFLPWEWQDWMSVSLIAVYLAFFPVAVNGLRGLQSPSQDAAELMDSYAAGWWQTLWKLRLPAALPYLIPAFKIAALASIIGAIIGEVSTSQTDGLGALILDFASKSVIAPERLYVAVLGAALLGLLAAWVVSLAEFVLKLRRRQVA